MNAGAATSEFDAAVVGAGVMGATVALQLSRGGMRTALFDRGGVCAEASGVNAGTLTLHMTRAALIPYAMRGFDLWANASKWLGEDPGVTVAPGLSLAFTEAEAEMLEQRATIRRDHGAPIEIVSAARAIEIEPNLSEQVLLAAYCEMDGHITANFTGRAYRSALVKAGASLFEHCAVNTIQVSDAGFEIVHASGRIRARRLILAGGVWLEEMLSWLGVELPIKTLINQLAVTERIRPVMRTVLGVASGLLSMKQFANGTVLIGGGWQGRGDRDTRDTELVPDNLIGNLRLARFVIPDLADTRLVRTWLGFEAETMDALPVIGAVPGVAGAYIIGSAHSGYTSGPYMGHLLADELLGHTPEMPLFDPARLIGTLSATNRSAEIMHRSAT